MMLLRQGKMYFNLTAHAAMTAAHACNAMRTVAATHHALTRAHRRVAAMLWCIVTHCMRIVRASAARIEMDLGLRGAQRAENQCSCYE
jgi:hypothetical protein